MLRYTIHSIDTHHKHMRVLECYLAYEEKVPHGADAFQQHNSIANFLCSSTRLLWIFYKLSTPWAMNNVLDMRTQNGDEPVGEITFLGAKLPF